MKDKIFCNDFLMMRINHDVMSIDNLANMLNMTTETLQGKLEDYEYLDLDDINDILNVLNVSSKEECCLLFFFHAEESKKAHFNLYKAIVENNINIVTVASEIGGTKATLVGKIAGRSEFRWSEVICIKEKFFPNYTLENLFERGVAV